MYLLTYLIRQTNNVFKGQEKAPVLTAFSPMAAFSSKYNDFLAGTQSQLVSKV